MCASGSSIDQERERERDVESYVYLLFQLQAGGDMFLMTNFHASCVRQGFIVDEEPHYHSEIFSLHGFHFELKAVKQTGRKGTYTFYMQVSFLQTLIKYSLD